MNSNLRVAVIGAGISGLTTALTFLRDGHSIELFSHHDVEETTSNAAAAFWYPFWTGAEPDHSWYNRTWAEETYRHLVGELFDNAPGVAAVNLVEYFDSTLTEFERAAIIKGMWWQSMPETKFRKLESDEIPQLKNGTQLTHGVTFNTIVVNMTTYLKYLYGEFDKFGSQASLNYQKIMPNGDGGLTIEKLDVDGYDLVINCSGLGAYELVNDKTMFGTEGVVVRASNSIDHEKITLLHTGEFSDWPVYIVPRPKPDNDVILGGTLSVKSHTANTMVEKTEWCLPNQHYKLAEDVMERCEAIVPNVSELTPLEVIMGLRPSRDSRVCLGFETSKLAHNYGHGGGGMTLSWGCAKWLLDNLPDGNTKLPFEAPI